MIILGLLILLVVAAAAVGAVVRGASPVSVDLQLFTVKTDGRGMLIAGIILTCLFLIGVWFVRAGVKRGHRRRSEVKGLRKKAAHNQEVAQRERAANAERNDTATTREDPPPSRGASASGPTDAHPDSSG